jgi:hypothetical protein
VSAWRSGSAQQVAERYFSPVFESQRSELGADYYHLPVLWCFVCLAGEPPSDFARLIAGAAEVLEQDPIVGAQVLRRNRLASVRP